MRLLNFIVFLGYRYILVNKMKKKVNIFQVWAWQFRDVCERKSAGAAVLGGFCA